MTADKPAPGQDPGDFSKRRPYRSLYDQCNHALASVPGSGLTPYNLMAISIQESMGNPFFCACDMLFQTNIKKVTEWTDIPKAEFLEAVTVQGGINRRKIAKFRMEPIWLALWFNKLQNEGLSRINSAVLCCSFGMTQKSAYYLTEKMDLSERVAYLRVFMGSPDMQLKALIHDLFYLVKESEHNMPLAYTRYNAGPSAAHVSDYGRKVDALSAQMMKLYQAG